MCDDIFKIPNQCLLFYLCTLHASLSGPSAQKDGRSVLKNEEFKAVGGCKRSCRTAWHSYVPPLQYLLACGVQNPLPVYILKCTLQSAWPPACNTDIRYQTIHINTPQLLGHILASSPFHSEPLP